MTNFIGNLIFIVCIIVINILYLTKVITFDNYITSAILFIVCQNFANSSEHIKL